MQDFVDAKAVEHLLLRVSSMLDQSNLLPGGPLVHPTELTMDPEAIVLLLKAAEDAGLTKLGTTIAKFREYCESSDPVWFLTLHL